MSRDPRDVIAESPMSILQIAVIGITICLNALDGFDVLSISFASNGIAKEWGVNPGALGIVLSMELIGMAIGSASIGGIADQLGHARPSMTQDVYMGRKIVNPLTAAALDAAMRPTSAE